MRGIAIRMSQIFPCLIVKHPLRQTFYCSSYFPDEETKTQGKKVPEEGPGAVKPGAQIRTRKSHAKASINLNIIKKIFKKEHMKRGLIQTKAKINEIINK